MGVPFEDIRPRGLALSQDASFFLPFSFPPVSFFPFYPTMKEHGKMIAISGSGKIISRQNTNQLDSYS